MSQTALISYMLICSAGKWKEGERVRNGAVDTKYQVSGTDVCD